MPRHEFGLPNMYATLKDAAPAPAPASKEALQSDEPESAPEPKPAPQQNQPTVGEDAKSAAVSAGQLISSAIDKAPVVGGLFRLVGSVGKLGRDVVTGHGGEGLKKFAASVPGTAATMAGGGIVGDVVDTAVEKGGKAAGLSENMLPKSDISNLMDIGQRRMGGEAPPTSAPDAGEPDSSAPEPAGADASPEPADEPAIEPHRPDSTPAPTGPHHDLSL